LEQAMSEAKAGSAGETETVGMDVLAGLIDETRRGLATLRADELEELAQRAQQLDRAALRGMDLRELAVRHRVLGELLDATAGNLLVLRRMRGESAESRWGR
jgi:hypothetical protein